MRKGTSSHPVEEWFAIYLKGIKLREIGAEYGVTTRTVSSALYRYLKHNPELKKLPRVNFICGHPRTEENTHWLKSAGTLVCLICKRMRSRKAYLVRKSSNTKVLVSTPKIPN